MAGSFVDYIEPIHSHGPLPCKTFRITTNDPEIQRQMECSGICDTHPTHRHVVVKYIDDYVLIAEKMIDLIGKFGHGHFAIVAA